MLRACTLTGFHPHGLSDTEMYQVRPPFLSVSRPVRARAAPGPAHMRGRVFALGGCVFAARMCAATLVP